jgi:hypothetical protein
VIARRVGQVLFHAEVALGGADAGVAQTELDLLEASWDYLMWLDIDFETMIERARKRDAAWVGSEAIVAKRYRRLWIPIHRLYEQLTNARARADAFIDNRDVQSPVLRRLGRLPTVT